MDEGLVFFFGAVKQVVGCDVLILHSEKSLGPPTALECSSS